MPGPGGGPPRPPRTGRRPRGRVPGWSRRGPAPCATREWPGCWRISTVPRARACREGVVGGSPEGPQEPAPAVIGDGQLLGGQGVAGQPFEDLLRAAKGRIGGRVLAQLLLDLADPPRGLARLPAHLGRGVVRPGEPLVEPQRLEEELALERLHLRLLGQPLLGHLGVHVVDGRAGELEVGLGPRLLAVDQHVADGQPGDRRDQQAPPRRSPPSGAAAPSGRPAARTARGRPRPARRPASARRPRPAPGARRSGPRASVPSP